MRKAGMPTTGTNRMSRSQAEDEDGRRFSGTTPIAMTLTAYSMTITVTDATEATTLRSICSHFPLRSGTHLRPPYRLVPARDRTSPAEAAPPSRTMGTRFAEAAPHDRTEVRGPSAGAFRVRNRRRLCVRACFRSWAERSESEFAGDEHELDLGGAFADLEDLRVAVVASDEVFVHEAVAAVDLGGVASIVHGCFAGDHLRNGGFLLERQSGEHPRSREVVRRPGGDDAGLHTGDLEGDALEVGDRLAEGLALLRVLHGFVDTALGGADGQGADGDAALVEDAQEVRVAASAFAEQVLFGHLHIVEGERVRVRGVPADLVIGRFGGEAGGAGRDHDRRNLGHLTAGLRGPGPGHGGGGNEPGDVGAGVRDEALAAVDRPGAVLQGGLGPGASGIGAGFGFGQAEGSQARGVGELGQPFLLLLFGAEAVDRHRAQGDSGLEGDRQRLVDPADLLDGQAQGEVVAAHAAVLLVEGQTEQPHLPHLGDEGVGELVLGIELGGHGCDFVVGELRHPLAQVFVFFGQHARDKGLHGFLPRRWRGCRGLGGLSCSAGAGAAVRSPARFVSSDRSARSPIPASPAMSSATSVASTSSSPTWAPSTAVTETMPAAGAVSTCSIFIASTTTIGSPWSTLSPVSTRTATTAPGIGARTSAPSSPGVSEESASGRVKTWMPRSVLTQMVRSPASEKIRAVCWTPPRTTRQRPSA